MQMAHSTLGFSMDLRGPTDGSLETNLPPVIFDYYSEIDCSALQNDGKLLIGGPFGKVNGETRHNVARLGSDGTLDSSFRNELTLSIYGLSSLALQKDGKLL